MRKKRYTTLKVIGEFLCIVGRVLRSALFNVLIFILGFGSAYIFTTCTMEENAASETGVEMIKKLEHDVEHLQVAVSHFQKQIEIYKFQMSHRMHLENSSEK